MSPVTFGIESVYSYVTGILQLPDAELFRFNKPLGLITPMTAFGRKGMQLPNKFPNQG